MKKINTIFIIDDDSITVFGIKKLLSSVVECTTILDFGNGKEAIDALQLLAANPNHLPDIIFLDLNMPILDGWGFLDAFLSIPLQKLITVNIVTSSINQSDKDRAMEYKAKTNHRLTYNTKPLNKEEIRKITHSVL